MVYANHNTNAWLYFTNFEIIAKILRGFKELYDDYAYSLNGEGFVFLEK